VSPRRCVGLTTICVNAGDLLQEQILCLSPSLWSPLSAAVEAALGDLQYPTHPADRVLCLVRLDTCLDQLRARRSSSLAINVAAFLGSRAPPLAPSPLFAQAPQLLAFSSVVSPSHSPESICVESVYVSFCTLFFPQHSCELVENLRELRQDEVRG